MCLLPPRRQAGGASLAFPQLPGTVALAAHPELLFTAFRELPAHVLRCASHEGGVHTRARSAAARARGVQRAPASRAQHLLLLRLLLSIHRNVGYRCRPPLLALPLIRRRQRLWRQRVVRPTGRLTPPRFYQARGLGALLPMPGRSDVRELFHLTHRRLLPRQLLHHAKRGTRLLSRLPPMPGRRRGQGGACHGTCGHLLPVAPPGWRRRLLSLLCRLRRRPPGRLPIQALGLAAPPRPALPRALRVPLLARLPAPRRRPVLLRQRLPLLRGGLRRGLRVCCCTGLRRISPARPPLPASRLWWAACRHASRSHRRRGRRRRCRRQRRLCW